MSWSSNNLQRKGGGTVQKHEKTCPILHVKDQLQFSLQQIGLRTSNLNHYPSLLNEEGTIQGGEMISPDYTTLYLKSQPSYP